MVNIFPEIALYLTVVLSFAVTYLLIPPIVRLARHKNFYDAPSHRRSHVNQVPTLGGVAIFAGFTVSAGSFISYQFLPAIQYILVACIVIFFVGLKDDIQSITPYKKLIGQIAAALVLIIPGNLYFSSLHGFLGIYEYNSQVVGLFLTAFIIILIINSINLIDGIDGLASSVGILATLFFGTWFYLSGNIEYCLISAAMLGALLGFFRFNVSDGKLKIFMGDTGSMLLGLLLSVQIIMFNELNINASENMFHISAAPAVSFAVLIIPLFDTLRVFIIRMSRGRSPFSADKNHLHHCMLKLGFTHVQSTLLIVLVNILFIGKALLLQYLEVSIFLIMIILIVIATVFSLTIEQLVKRKKK